MKSFKQLSEELGGTAAAAQKLKKMKSGETVSFTHHKHGEVSGSYQGMKRMGGRSYAAVEHPKHGRFYVPPHQINQAK